ncbi:U-box domain-containing protein 27-like [Prosopis cineraria]|uniref:U-box domain-containing protein 27-like n=1 Tax=Prosopis cineraria TaxID=364024 RepID=UPI00240F26F0|nr:U-box domain-containing protein 27-like [Prosopis cineraria]
MLRDDLCITIPSFFRCPISLDVMKSPVSLCTGVTYDRSSIQRWLDDGNTTCPATMQVLQSKEFVPNLTLQRLIQIWTDSVRTRVESAGSPAAKSVPSRDQVLDAVTDLKAKSGNPLCSLAGILSFAEESENNREFLAKIEGLVPLLVGFLDNVDGGIPRSVEFLEKVVKALDFVLSKAQDDETVKHSIVKNQQGNCIASLLLVLQRGSSDSRIASAKVLKFAAADVESKILIAEKEGLIRGLFKMISSDGDAMLIENGLSCLVAISTPKRNKARLIHLGVVKTLSELLSESKWSVAITENVLTLLETVSSTREGRSQICEDPTCVASILQKVLKVSNAATEHAVTILWSVCYVFRDQKAQEAVTKAHGLTKILLLMQSNCSPGVRQMCADLLKIFRVNSKSCLSCYHTKTTHIMPF